MIELPLFPLRSVLYPGGQLPLKIFEQRYLDMTKACIRDNAAFGVCLIRAGNEVGAPATPHEVGCTARIEHWEMPHLGIFHLLARGEHVFRIVEQWVEQNGLQRARVELCEAVPPQGESADQTIMSELLARIIDKLGAENFPEPLRLDDPQWVSWRLCEVLPLDDAFKQDMLETIDTAARLHRLRAYLNSQSVPI
ncbi:MAG TPA: LON peptidase substrate-binding domain-containing protein [Burkholderiales bacterium]|nr:LON peptidase substrate-binding domain-containing protein [Burkholderiales bacterium]